VIKLICPVCMKTVPVPDGFTDRQVTCPSCSHAFELPSRSTPEVLTDPVSEPSRPLSVAASQPVVSQPVASSSSQPESSSPSGPVPFSLTDTEPPPMSTDPPFDRPPPPPGLVPPPPPTTAQAAPPPPPGLVLRSPPSAPAATANPSSAASLDVPVLPGGYTRAWGLTISPRVVAWLPAILLTVTVVSTFFPWVGSYLGGYPVYSQSPWRALFGSVSRNFALEERMPGDRSWLDNLRSDWEVLIPYLLLLVAAVALAWADRGLSTFDPRQVPPLAKLWPWRKSLIAGLAGLAFLLMFAQVSRGFGMERAIRKMVRENPEIAKLREEAGASVARLAVVENKEDQELAKYNLEVTSWQRLGLTCNFLAPLLAVLSIGLERRGDKPPPKILLHF
jgi:hypothetical protein